MGEGDRADERFSTEGLEFEPALRRVLAGGREDEAQGEQGENVATGTYELTDEELSAMVKSTRRDVASGKLPLFRDKHALREDIRRRFGR